MFFLCILLQDPVNIPESPSNTLVDWTIPASIGTFGLKSGYQYDSTSGRYVVENYGFYFISSNLMIESNTTNTTELGVVFDGFGMKGPIMIKARNR